MGELFGVELVDGVVDGVPVGEVDASLGEGGGDLFGGAPGGFVVEGVVEDGQVGVNRVDDRADPLGADVALSEGETQPCAQHVGQGGALVGVEDRSCGVASR